VDTSPLFSKIFDKIKKTVEEESKEHPTDG